DIRYAPATDKLFGEATIDATATQDLSSFNLDFVGMRVRSVTIDGSPATWDREERHELVVTPAMPIADGVGFTVVVDYDGVPKSPLSYGARVGAVRTDDGVLIYGEPDVAAFWYPANDHPRDKATFRIDLTVPRGLEAISNGRFLGRRSAGHGRVTWSWEELSPMATYLAMAVIGRFETDRYVTDDGIRVFDAVDPRVNDAAVRSSLAKEGRVTRFLEGWFGAYPFDDLGGIVDRWPHGFALETQTRPIYPPSFFDRGPNPSIIVHELAHQWFGDSVSLDEWQHMWLNEGFATYAEWLWFARKGAMGVQSISAAWCRSHPVGNRFWQVTPGDPGVNRLFSLPVYVRGALTLQALRKTVGTADFLEIVHAWLADHADSTGSTDEFIHLSETVSGQELSPFFDEWLFTGAKPTPCVVGGASRTGSGRPPMPAVFDAGDTAPGSS
ncbi:MAG: M1 family metallopeptidase, partial [Actinomycetota bacterium]